MSEVQRFLMAGGAVRIEAVQLTHAWQAIIERRTYPLAVQQLLGELVAASALLAATLKFNGTLTLQAQGSGAVRLAVVECRSTAQHNSLSVRATAKLAQDAVQQAEHADFQTLLNAHDHGRLMVVLDPQDKLPGQQAYSGIVPLSGNSVAQCLAHYFEHSEQLPTQLWLATDAQNACGLLIQRMPQEGGITQIDTDAWPRAQHLAATIKQQELLSLPSSELVRRVFYEETVTVLQALPVRFACSCSREKVAGVLRMLGRAEIESILQERDTITVDCEYCGKTYAFDAVDAASALLEVDSSKANNTLQ
jgi:molecular chaperone Hsp33